jgi:hypothetical protein
MDKFEDKHIEIVKKINSTLRCNHLTGRAMDDVCTDGYDVEYTILSMKILKIIIDELEKGK